jgi:hypothetical protein
MRQAARITPMENRSRTSVNDDKRGSLRWVRDVLGRAFRLEPRRHPAQATPADPRRAAAEAPLPLLVQQRAELGARLLVHDPATQVVRHLFIIHDELRISGWPGVEALPHKLIGRALTEAEILASQEPTPLLQTLIDRLREIIAVADARVADEAREALRREWDKPHRPPEVSETNYDEYELMERSWVGTVPAGL